MGGLQTDKQLLENEISEFHKKRIYYQRIDFIFFMVLVVSGLILSAAVTILGAFNLGIFSVIPGTILLIVVGLQTAFDPGEKSRFQSIVEAASANLLTDLNQQNVTEQQIERARKKLKILRDSTAQSLPRGQGMEAVLKMTNQISSVK